MMNFDAKSIARIADALILAMGSLLTLYIIIASLGLIRNSAEHYTTFVFCILFMATVHAINMVVQSKGQYSSRRWMLLLISLASSGFFAVFGAAYLRLNAVRIEALAPRLNDLDLTVGLLMLFGILGLTWFHWGGILTGMIAAVIAYFFFGHLVPHPLLQHPEYDFSFIMNYVGLSLSNGMFWLTQIAADKLYLLVIYASVLLGIGMLPLVIELGKITGLRFRGGSAFPAVIGSAVVGTVMGQGTANVMLTGRFTIPAMNKSGFSKEMAGAIEAVASLSGQILPPIMGLAGFIIASTLNIPYIDVALAALLPGLLFITGLTVGILTYAGRDKIPKIKEEIDYEVIIRLLPTFLASFGILLYLLLEYLSPSIAALAAIAVAVVLSVFQGCYRPKWKALLSAYTEGLRTVTVLALLLIAIGPLAQTFLTTNISSRVAILLVSFLPESQTLMLGIAAVISLILGLGLPTPVAYMVGALTAVPFLQIVGINDFLAHFFVFYFSVFSALSPPVAVAALAASKVSGGSFIGTAVSGLKLMVPMLIIPFAFTANPDLLGFPNLTSSAIVSFASLLLIQTFIAWAVFGYCFGAIGLVTRMVLFLIAASGLLILITDHQNYSLGFLAVSIGLAKALSKSKKIREKLGDNARSSTTIMEAE